MFDKQEHTILQKSVTVLQSNRAGEGEPMFSSGPPYCDSFSVIVGRILNGT